MAKLNSLFRSSNGNFLTKAAALLLSTMSVVHADAPQNDFFWGLSSPTDIDYLLENPQMVQDGSPLLFENMSVFDIDPEALGEEFEWNIESDSPLKFGLYRTADPAALTLDNLQSEDPVVIRRALDLRVYSTALSEPSSLAASAVHITDRRADFLDSVSITSLYGEDAEVPVIYLGGASVTQFHKDLTVNATLTDRPVIQVSDEASLVLAGPTVLSSGSTALSVNGKAKVKSFGDLTIQNRGHAPGIINRGTVEVSGALTIRSLLNDAGDARPAVPSPAILNQEKAVFNALGGLTIEASSVSGDQKTPAVAGIENNGFLNLSGTVVIRADQALSGNGTVGAGLIMPTSGWGAAQQTAPAEVTIEGSLAQYRGSWTQKGGSFTLTGDANFRPDLWKFENTDITTSSANLFTVSADQYDGRFFKASASVIGGTIVLTDEKFDLAYLSEAVKLYESSVITYTGELFIDHEKQTNITLEHDFGLLEQDQIGLASVNLDLGDRTELEGKKFHIGSLSSTQETLRLTNSNIVLYGTGRGSVTGDIKWVAVDDNSRLEIHGLTYGQAREAQKRAAVSSSLYIAQGGELVFKGSSVMEPDAHLVSAGKVNFASGSMTETYGDIYQNGGTLTVESEALLESEKGVYVSGAEVRLDGALKAKDFAVSDASVLVSGLLQAQSLKFGADSRSEGSRMLLTGGASAEFDTAVTGTGQISVTGSKDKGVYSALTLREWSGSGTQITVGENGILILGSSPEVLPMTPDFVFWAASTVEAEVSAVLGIGGTVALSGSNQITIGNTASGRAEGQPLHFGADSSLVIRPNLNAPAFTAADAEAGISFEQGSQILVVDPFGTNQLTDETLSRLEGAENAALVSANRHVSLILNHVEGSGWFIERTETDTSTGAVTDFVYSKLQGWLYDNPEGFTIDSENAAQRFFARVDNDEFMHANYSSALIGEATLLPSLLGSRLNEVRAAGSLSSQVSAETDRLLSGKTAGTYWFGDIGGGYFISKTRADYLSSGKYRSASQDFMFGLAHLSESETAYTAAVQVSRFSNKSRGTVLSAEGKQYVFGVSASAAKDFGRVRLKGSLGFGGSHDDIDAHLPGSMQMDKLSAKNNSSYVTIAGEAGLKVTDHLEIAIAPRLWVLPKTTEKTDIGSQRAFELKTKTQTFADFPLMLKGRVGVGEVFGAKVEAEGEMGGLIRVGQLDKKGTLKAVGTGASENISQKEFSRWNAFAGAGVSFTKGALKTSVKAKAMSGDGRVDASVSFKADWRF